MGFGFGGGGSGKKFSGELILAGGYKNANCGGSTAEITLASFTLPANTLGAGGSLVIETEWLAENTAAVKTARVRIGGIGGVTYLASSLANNATAHALTTIWASGTAAQFGYSSSLAPFGSSSGGEFSSSVDTTQDQSILITGQVALDTAISSPTVTGNGNLTTVSATAHGLSSGDFIQVAGGSAGSVSGSPNVDPVAITKIDANTFTYASNLSGTLTVQPTIKRYPLLALRSYVIKLRNP